MVQKQEAIKKVKALQSEINEKYKPDIDPKKREKVQERIRELELSADKTKRKVKM